MSIVINIPLGQKKEGKVATVNVGSNTFEVSVEPENIERIAYVCIEVGESLNDMSDFEATKNGLTKAFDFVFGEGAFEKIWTESGSLIECSKVFLQISDQLMNAIPKPTQAQKAEQFVKHKKNKKRKK